MVDYWQITASLWKGERYCRDGGFLQLGCFLSKVEYFSNRLNVTAKQSSSKLTFKQGSLIGHLRFIANLLQFRNQMVGGERPVVIKLF